VDLISLKCPNCGGMIQLDTSKEFGFCMYCGNKVMLRKDVNLTINVGAKKSLENYIKLADYAWDKSNYKDLSKYAETIRELDPANPWGWLYRGLSYLNSPRPVASDRQEVFACIERGFSLCSTQNDIERFFSIVSADVAFWVATVSCDMDYLRGILSPLCPENNVFLYGRNSLIISMTLEKTLNTIQNNQDLSPTSLMDCIYMVLFALESETSGLTCLKILSWVDLIANLNEQYGTKWSYYYNKTLTELNVLWEIKKVFEDGLSAITYEKDADAIKYWSERPLLKPGLYHYFMQDGIDLWHNINKQETADQPQIVNKAKRSFLRQKREGKIIDESSPCIEYGGAISLFREYVKYAFFEYEDVEYSQPTTK